MSADVEPNKLLSRFLRDDLDLNGTHVGCDTSQCGVCVVHVDGIAVKSCTMLAVQAQGADVMTVEGLAAGGELHPLQQAFMDEHGLQCGYCTPGMLMRSFRFLQENPDPSEEAIRTGMSGNLCRCTGYQNIVKSIQKAAAVINENDQSQAKSA